MKPKKLRITLSDYVRAAKRADRTAEIQEHGRPVSFKRVHKSRKVYDRKRLKAGDKRNLPLLFVKLASSIIKCYFCALH